MFRLAWPALMENLLSTMAQFVDTAMVGSLGALATAAIAVNTTPMWLFNGLVSAISVGGTALVARAIGAQDQEGAEAACRQVFLGIICFATALFLIAQALAAQIPVWMRADASIHMDAAAYIRIVSLAFIPHFTGMALGAVMRGAGDTRTPMRISMAANLLNVVGNFLLIYPTRSLSIGPFAFTMWGAGLGIRGAAISTALCNALAGLAMVLLITRHRSRLRLSLQRLRPDFSILRRILRVGTPAALERVTINIGQLVFVSMIASLGNAALAGHHLSITVESLSYMPGFAFGIAATTLVGQSLGAGDPDRAKARGALSIGTGVLAMSFIGILLFLFAPQLIALLTPDAEVRAIGAMLIRICALEQPFMSLNMVSSGALRGAGDTRVPFLVSLIGMWSFRIIPAYICIHSLGLGVDSAWYAMVADQAVRGILMGLRFARGKWVSAKV